ncbi:MAG: 2-C-methyl-D-erythritol 4-phosphate cytidylyltransferase, partial [Oscillospiraceae bacterium]|nr:2-C-methyl-D-erythritol 4-phosphate cytidylyltransferase [Oscillospiraceae bacterium]
QAFTAELIKAAITDALRKNQNPTDDCAAVEAIGATVHLTAGSYENIKLTTLEDVLLAEAILKGRAL